MLQPPVGEFPCGLVGEDAVALGRVDGLPFGWVLFVCHKAGHRSHLPGNVCQRKCEERRLGNVFLPVKPEPLRKTELLLLSNNNNKKKKKKKKKN